MIGENYYIKKYKRLYLFTVFPDNYPRCRFYISAGWRAGMDRAVFSAIAARVHERLRDRIRKPAPAVLAGGEAGPQLD
jgi:hypothetical protein